MPEACLCLDFHIREPVNPTFCLHYFAMRSLYLQTRSFHSDPTSVLQVSVEGLIQLSPNQPRWVLSHVDATEEKNPFCPLHLDHE